MIIWINIMHNLLNINISESHFMINAKNRWKEIHCNDLINYKLTKNAQYHCFLFELLNKKDNKDGFIKRIKHFFDIVENPFHSEEYKEKAVELFHQTQKRYCILQKFVSLCKEKISKPKVTVDLCLNEIILKKGISTSIIQDGNIYYFTLRDLIHICNNALLFSVDFFCDPHRPKNPYTNKIFSKSILLKIYYEIRYSNYKMPILLELFYKEFFHIKSFLDKNEYTIREEVIDDFVKNASKEDKYLEIRDMLALKFIRKKIVIERGFPEKPLMAAFEPFLRDYLISEYSLRNLDKKWINLCLLKYKLFKFHQKNPSFGRKIVKFNENNDMNNNNSSNNVKYKHVFQTEFVSIDHNNVPRHRDVMATLEVYKEESDTEDTISSVDSDDESVEDLHVMDETLFQTPSRSPTPPTDVASPTPTNLTSPTLSVSPDIFPINTISNENHPVARQLNSEFLDDFYDSIFDNDDNDVNEILDENN